jgi:excisionase family DNA binding protein
MTPVPAPEPLPTRRGRPSLVYKAEEVAAALQLSITTVYRRAECGDLPSEKIGGAVRFPKIKMDAYYRQMGLIQ